MAKLIIEPGTRSERVVELPIGESTVGRSSQTTIPIRDPSLSRVHARFTRTDDSVHLQDLESTNGTMVNGDPIRACNLLNGDFIVFGSISVSFEEPPEIVSELEETESSVELDDLLSSEAEVGSSDESSAGSVDQDRVQILLKISEILASLRDLPPLLKRTLELLFQIVEVDRAVILLTSSVTGRPEPVAVKTHSRSATLVQSDEDEPLDGAPPVDAGETTQRVSRQGLQERDRGFYSRHIVEHVLKKGVAVLTTDADADARFEASESIHAQSIRASMCAPLRFQGRIHGALYVDNVGASSAFRQGDLAFFSAFAGQAAIAIGHFWHLEERRVAQKREDCLRRSLPPALLPKALSGDTDLGLRQAPVSLLRFGFAELARIPTRVEPVDLAESVEELWDCLTRIIFHHGGVLSRSAGGLLATFGAFGESDHVQRALQSAVTTLTTLSSMDRPDSGARFPVAVETGDAVAGFVGEGDHRAFVVLGEPVTRVNLLQALAGPGELLVTKAALSAATPNLLPPSESVELDESFDGEIFRLRWDLSVPGD